MLQTVINLFLIVAAIAATLPLAYSALRIWHTINRSN
jgi:hypothetical protein